MIYKIIIEIKKHYGKQIVACDRFEIFIVGEVISNMSVFRESKTVKCTC